MGRHSEVPAWHCLGRTSGHAGHRPAACSAHCCAPSPPARVSSSPNFERAHGGDPIIQFPRPINRLAPSSTRPATPTTPQAVRLDTGPLPQPSRIPEVTRTASGGTVAVRATAVEKTTCGYYPCRFRVILDALRVLLTLAPPHPVALPQRLCRAPARRSA